LFQKQGPSQSDGVRNGVSFTAVKTAKQADTDMKLNWPFGNRTREQKTAWPLVALSEPRAANWGGRDAGALIRDGYLRNAVAYRCIRMIAEACASIPLKTLHIGAGELLRRPGPDMAPAGFLEAVYSDLQLSGNAFVEAVRLPGERAVAALFPLRSVHVRPVTDARGWVEAWAIRGRNGQERMVRRDAEGWLPLLHVKLYNPADEVIGLPPLAPARRALDLHNASADWAKALIDNSAKPSGALVYGGGGRMSPDQFDRLKAELEASFSGAANAGRPLLLEGGLEWQALSLSPAEMDFQAARAAAAREIALAIGVPPMLLGIPGDNTYANYREANLAFWRMTVLPLAGRFAEAMSHWLDGAFGEDVEVELDLDRVPALATEREALWSRLEDASFVTREEKRRMAGVEP
jgi:HK97 family phage portal protein